MQAIIVVMYSDIIILLIITLIIEIPLLLHEITASSNQVNSNHIKDSSAFFEFNFLNREWLNFTSQRWSRKQLSEHTEDFVMIWKNNTESATSKMKREINYNFQEYNTDYEKLLNKGSNINSLSFTQRQFQPFSIIQFLITLLVVISLQIEDFFQYLLCPQEGQNSRHSEVEDFFTARLFFPSINIGIPLRNNFPFKICPEGKFNS